MLLRFRPLFYGGSGEEAENFIRAVCDKAIDKEKQEDNKWIAMYASSCLAGEALRWYTSLDSATQEDWKKLQQAVLVQYPRDTPGSTPLNTIPTPAAASAPKASGRGRIRVSSNSCSTPLYLSKYLAGGRVSASSSLANALEVEWNPGAEGPQMLSIPNSQIPGYDVLGVRWKLNSSKPSDDNYLAICAVNSQTNSTASSTFSGDILTNVWKLSSEGGRAGLMTVSPVVSGGEELFGRWNNPSKFVWFAAKSVHSDYTAGVFFEPI
ncbi:hypothetical protein M407DRAFT_174948 [Tulasnella calospora MUT 4182]|uniref:Retrotransposon gag domain-containing protein n=1 Tax=Tulasnella calospora MUT 4182 TaxID=1051891 RepID=A0A0C3Q2U4_9AGAM|nr:hypothetical protein M407DRAFT_174948 [Tulasnella calospora MUT 4182]